MEGRHEEEKEKRTGQGCSILALLLITAINGESSFSAPCGGAARHRLKTPWDGVSMTMPETDENGTYLIRTGAELAWFAAEVNRGSGEINGRLENYIYLNDYNTSS